MKQPKQAGFVSIIVALITMIFVSLLALGFAFLARQNQAQSQNQALSTQAFYAAESGVNDAVKYLNTSGAVAQRTDCNDRTGFATTYGTQTVGSTNSDVKYTCILYDTTPTSLEYTVNTQNSKVIQMESTTTDPITDITISWQDDGGSTTFANSPVHALPQTSFPPIGGNNLSQNTGIVRATIIPIPPTPGASITRDGLLSNSQTLFLYPNKVNPGGSGPGIQPYLSNGGTNATDSGQGAFVDGKCNNPPTASLPRYCNVKITGLGVANTNKFYLRLVGIYRQSKVTITARANSSQVSFLNSQAVVDATGKADDVLRRIQVRVPLGTSYYHPEFAIESMDSICKRLVVAPGPGGTTIDTGGLNLSLAQTKACQIQ